MAERITWANETRRLGDLIPWPRNPRQIKKEQAKRLKQSFEDFGQVETIAIGPGNEVYNGHQRLNVLMAEHGADYVVEVRVSSRALTEKERERLTVYLHKGAAGEFDWGELANWNTAELLEWGIENADFEAHGIKLDANGEPVSDPGSQVDRAEELREKWGVEPGQLWQLGEHRLICGDCTDGETLARLFADTKYDSMITDPPFFTPATHYQSRVKHQRKFSDLSSLASFWELVMTKTDEYRKSESHCVVFCNCDSYAVFYPVMFSRFEKTKSLVWDKMHVGLGRVFRHQHELMIWGRNAGHYFVQDGVLRADVIPCEATPSKDRDHPVEKPTELYEALVIPLTPERGITFDPFCGAGHILVAGERNNRIAYTSDIDPAYVAVALERWHTMTGKTPELLEAQP